MKKLNSIQVLRGVASIAVVLYHMLIIEKKYSGGDLYLPAVFKIGQSGVDLFFVISGFIMVTITQRKWGPEVDRGEFLLHRFARIYPNYWFYFFVTLSVIIVQPTLVNASQGNQFNFFTSLLLIPSSTLPLVLVAWSLIYEVYFYLVFSTILKFRKKQVVTFLFVWLIFLITVNFFYRYPLNPVIGLLTSPYSIEFILGAFSALLISNKRVQRFPVWFFLVIIMGLILAMPFLFHRFYATDLTEVFRQSIVFGIVFSLLVIASVELEKRLDLRLPAFLIKIGDVSYTIYLSHVLILGVTGRLWAAYFQKPFLVWDNLLVFPIMLAAIITYSFIAYRLIEYPSYHLFVRLVSKKRSVSK